MPLIFGRTTLLIQFKVGLASLWVAGFDFEHFLSTNWVPLGRKVLCDQAGHDTFI